MNEAMHALRFEKTGSLDELGIKDMPVPKPADGEVLVQVKAAAINPSDIKNVLGKMHQTTVPRTPGRDFAGIVTEGPKELLKLSFEETAEILRSLLPAIESGDLPLPNVETFPLVQAPEVYRGIDSSTIKGESRSYSVASRLSCRSYVSSGRATACRSSDSYSQVVPNVA